MAFFLQQTGVFLAGSMLAVLCCVLSGRLPGGERQGAEAGRRLFFYMERRDHGSGMDWQPAGCILLGFGRMKLEIRERVLEEQAAAERGGGVPGHKRPGGGDWRDRLRIPANGIRL